MVRCRRRRRHRVERGNDEHGSRGRGRSCRGEVRGVAAGRSGRGARPLKSLVLSILVALPVSIAIFLFMTAIAISNKTEWYVWVSLGVGLGVIGAVLLGSLAGATLNAHKLDEVDRHTYGA